MLIHPIIIHFPIAFAYLELLLLLLWKFRSDPVFLRFARFAFRLCYLGMIAAVCAGLIDAGGIKGIVGKVRPHAILAVCTVVFSTVRFVYWQSKASGEVCSPAVLMMGSVVMCVLIAATAFEGGEIVYGG